MNNTRRFFLKSLLAGGGCSLLFPRQLTPAVGRETSGYSSGWKKLERKFGFSLGLASYTFRAFTLDQTIQMTRRLALEKIVLKDFHLSPDAPPDEVAREAKKVRDSGLDLYGAGVVYIQKPEEVEKIFRFAATAALRMLIAAPDPSLLPFIEKQVRQTGIQVAIHNHGPGDKFYPTPGDAYARIKNLDRRIGICLDVGHTARAGLDPAAEARRVSDRLLDVHLKDVSAAGPEGETVEIGRGVIDIKSFLKAIMAINYRGTLAFEFEKDEKDPLPGVAESVGYVRALLS